MAGRWFMASVILLIGSACFSADRGKLASVVADLHAKAKESGEPVQFAELVGVRSGEPITTMTVLFGEPDARGTTKELGDFGKALPGRDFLAYDKERVVLIAERNGVFTCGYVGVSRPGVSANLEELPPSAGVRTVGSLDQEALVGTTVAGATIRIMDARNGIPGVVDKEELAFIESKQDRKLTFLAAEVDNTNGKKEFDHNPFMWKAITKDKSEYKSIGGILIFESELKPLREMLDGSKNVAPKEKGYYLLVFSDALKPQETVAVGQDTYGDSKVLCFNKKIDGKPAK